MSTKIQISQVQGLENIALNYTTVSGLLMQTGAAISGNLILTGTTLSSKITSLSGSLNLSGTNLDSKSDTISGDMVSTGTSLKGLINTLSGNLISTGNLSKIHSNSISGLLNTKINTLSGYVDSEDLSISGVLRTDLNSTGTFAANIGTRLDALSGDYTGTRSQSNINTAKVNTLSGDFYSDSATLTIATGDIASLQSEQVKNINIRNGISGNLITTGATLSSRINTVSGNLNSTGSNLNSKITSLSGRVDTNDTLISGDLRTDLNSTGNFAVTVSGNLNSTGSTLSNLVGANSKQSSQLGSLTYDPTASNILHKEVAFIAGSGSKYKVLQFVDYMSGAGKQIGLGVSAAEEAKIPTNTIWDVRIKGVAQNINQPSGVDMYVLETGFLLSRGSLNAEKRITFANGNEYSIGSGSAMSITPYIYNGSSTYLAISGDPGSYAAKFHIVAQVQETPSNY